MSDTYPEFIADQPVGTGSAVERTEWGAAVTDKDRQPLKPDLRDFGDTALDLTRTDFFRVVLSPSDVNQLSEAGISPEEIEDLLHQVLSGKLKEAGDGDPAAHFNGAVRFISAESERRQVNIRFSPDLFDIVNGYCFRLGRDATDWVGDVLQSYLDRYKHESIDIWAEILNIDIEKLADEFNTTVPSRRKRTLSPRMDDHFINQLDDLAQFLSCSRNKVIVSILMFQIAQTKDLLPSRRQGCHWSTVSTFEK